MSDLRDYFDLERADGRGALIRLLVGLALIVLVRVVIWPDVNGYLLVIAAVLVSGWVALWSASRREKTSDRESST